MNITGTVKSVTRRPKPHGSLYLTVDVDGQRVKYLQTYQLIPEPGQKVEIAGVPMVGYKDVNVGAAVVRIIPEGGAR